MANTTQQQDLPEGSGTENRLTGRASVDIDCQIRIGTRAWRNARLADLTPDGFQVSLFDMPPRGTPLYIRFAKLQMLQAEVCWAKADTAGCQFLSPISPYIFDHIVAAAG